MNFNIKNIDLKQCKKTCCIIGVLGNNELFVSGKKLDNISAGYISHTLKISNFQAQIGNKLFLYNIPNIPSIHILLIGCGEINKLNKNNYKKIIYYLTKQLNKTNLTESINFLNELNIEKLNQYWKIRHTIEIINNALYNFSYFKNDKNPSNIHISNMYFNIDNTKEIHEGEKAIKHAVAISHGIELAKNLGNMPPNICTPTYLFKQAKKLDNHSKVTVKSINKTQMQDIGMHAYLSVSQGSKNLPLMSIIQYKGHNDDKDQPIILIGKGVTFDSGGISIKPSYKLDEMKYDMCGAAVVYGVLKVAIMLNLPINIFGILTGCENMISSKSMRPGDILSTLSGKTVEILNTDAEGRLILCDTLTYVKQYNPKIVIDIATLTGACVIALGHYFSALISNNQQLANKIILASQQSDDYVWQMPIIEELKEQIKSNIADFKNIGDGSGGTITAGYFLSQFAKTYHWAHLDIAGTAWTSKNKRESTGRPVALLSQFLINQVYNDQ